MFHNSAKFFAELVPVEVVDMNKNHSRTSRLFLTMEWQDASVAMNSKKELVMTLADNDDPFFLYDLHLSEEGFKQVKTSQTEDFNSFPQQIMNYLEEILEENDPKSRKELVFTINKKQGNAAAHSEFNLVEKSEFKNCTYFSLTFVAATESNVKQYLLSCYRQIQTLNREVQQLESCNSEILLGKTEKYDQDLKELRDQLKSEFDSENAKLDSTIKKLESTILSIEEENRRLKDEVKNSKKIYNNLNLDFDYQILYTQELKKKVEDLTQELLSKEETIKTLEKDMKLYASTC